MKWCSPRARRLSRWATSLAGEATDPEHDGSEGAQDQRPFRLRVKLNVACVEARRLRPLAEVACCRARSRARLEKVVDTVVRLVRALLVEETVALEHVAVGQ